MRSIFGCSLPLALIVVIPPSNDNERDNDAIECFRWHASMLASMFYLFVPGLLDYLDE